MATNQGFKSFVPNAGRVDAKFLYWWLRSNRPYLEGLGNGATFKEVSKSTVARVEIRIPPLTEQQRIAAILDKADELRAQRVVILNQLDTLPRAMFLDLFGDPATNPKRWPIVTFGEVGENQDSRRVPIKSSDRDHRKGPYPYYGASGIIDWFDDYIFDGERLLIGEDGANLVARATPVAYMARGKYWVNNHAHVIAHNNRADLRFLERFIELVDLNPYISGTAQPKLNRSNLDRILVPLPPLPLQQEFARRIDDLEKLKGAHRASHAEMEALFASLQHRAFRGEL
jgi:type I restriction enzyme S subunit